MLLFCENYKSNVKYNMFMNFYTTNVNIIAFFLARKHDYGRQATGGGENGYSDDEGACGYSGK